MARDGTARGGARVGAGRKPKALTDKINNGMSATVLELPEPSSIEGADIPPIKEYLRAKQKKWKRPVCRGSICGDMELVERKRQ